MSRTTREKMHVAKLREGLYGAALESEVVSLDDIDSVRFQKLMIEAVEYFDLRDQVTIEWYRHGDVIRAPTADMGMMGTDEGLPADGPYVPTEYPTIEEAKYFFLEKFRDWGRERIGSNFVEFLRSYYREHESIPYRHLYLSNLDVDSALKSAAANFRRGYTDVRRDIAQFQAACRDLKIALLLNWEFEAHPAYVDFIENAGVALLEQLQSVDASNADIADIVDQFDEFYYEAVWNAIASTISYHNITGPPSRRDEVIEERREELDRAADQFNNRYDSFQRWLAEEKSVDLDIPQVPDSLGSLAIDELNDDRTPGSGLNTLTDTEYRAMVLKRNKPRPYSTESDLFEAEVRRLAVDVVESRFDPDEPHYTPMGALELFWALHRLHAEEPPVSVERALASLAEFASDRAHYPVEDEPGVDSGDIGLLAAQLDDFVDEFPALLKRPFDDLSEGEQQQAEEFLQIFLNEWLPKEVRTPAV